MLVRDDLKLPDDSIREVPKPNRVVGSSIPNHKTVSLFDGKLVRWSDPTYILSKNKHQILFLSIYEI